MPHARSLHNVRREAIGGGESDALFQPIFIVGSPRSGTTLLSVILNRHSRLAVPPETHFAHEVVPAWFRRVSDARQHSGISHVIRDLLHTTPLKDLEVGANAVMSRMRHRAATPAELLKCALEEYAAARGKPRIAEKTPGHELHMELLARWFPKAKFVWIVRDGRDVVLSLRRAPWARPQPLWWFCIVWRRRMAEALRFVAKRPDMVYRIYYEALLREPERELTRLHHFLGLSLEPQQLIPDGPSDVIPAYKNRLTSKAIQVIDVRRSQAWRSESSKNQVLLMNCLMRAPLRTLGYTETSLKDFGPHMAMLCIIVDSCLAVMLGHRSYRVTRSAYRAVRCLLPARWRVRHRGT